MATRRKLILVSPTARFFRSHRLPIAIGALQAGYRVGVACPTGEESERLAEDGLQHFPVPISRSGMSPGAELATVRALLALFRQERPDVVHLITAKPALHGGLAARLVGIPSVTSVTGLGHLFMRSDLRARMLQASLLHAYRFGLNRRDNLFVFQNTVDRDTFAAYGLLRRAGQELVPGSGVDLEAIRPHPLPATVPVVLMPCRMLHDKGVAEFVEAAGILRSRGHNAIFRLMGDPDPANPTSLTLEQLQQIERDGIVEWKGFNPDINAALAQCAIVALPSYREGFPKTLIDAAAAGRAMVTTDVAGCRDAVIAGVTGLLCAPRSALALADALEKLLLDPALVSAMGAAARKDAESRFDIRQVVALHLGFYARQAG